MPEIQTKEWLAIRNHLTSFFTAQGKPVAWPNEAFQRPEPDEIFFRVTQLPNVNSRLFIGSNAPHMRQGLIQVDVYTPKNQGFTPARELAGKVAAHFPVDFSMRYDDMALTVYKAPDVSEGFADDTHWQTPVTVSYRYFG